MNCKLNSASLSFGPAAFGVWLVTEMKMRWTVMGRMMRRTMRRVSWVLVICLWPGEV